MRLIRRIPLPAARPRRSMGLPGAIERQAPHRDDELDLLAIEELEPRLTPDHLDDPSLPGPPGRTVGWGC